MKQAVAFYGIGVLFFSAALFWYNQKPIQKAQSVVVHTNPYAVGTTEVVQAAEALKAMLNKEQLAQLQLPYSKTDAARWSNFPQAFTRQKRVGLQLGSLNAQQLAAAKALLVLILSGNAANEGYDELQGILAADDYFGKAVNNTEVFNSGNFYLAFLGRPSTTGLWELQFGGHHLAIANTYNGGKLSGSTPSFRGVEPMAAFKVGAKTYQPLEGERATFAKLIGSLSENERAAAKLSATFSNLLLGPGKDGVFPQEQQGLKVGSLNKMRLPLVLQAIELYVKDLDAATAKALMEQYTAELPDTYVAFSGSGTMNEVGDYVRIDGPSVWIEYSAQPSRNFPGTSHPHSVWRDKTSDYGSTLSP